jgi:restriction system-associated AAA family ATPase
LKLIKLKILEDFRSLKPAGLEINFHSSKMDENLSIFHPFCFAGVNGTGKSNVLEALSNIFYHLECCTNGYPDYAFSKTESSPNAYELEYFIATKTKKQKAEDLVKISIIKNKNKSPYMSINGDKPIEISRKFGSGFLPDLVVAYSSGENETLSLPFVKMKLFQYDEYLKDFIGKKVYEKPKSSLLYIDYEMSQSVLLTTLLFFDEDVVKPLEKELEISGIQQFTINLKNNWQKIISNENSFFEVETISEDEDFKDIDGKLKYDWRILEHIEKQIEKLKDCATCSYLEDGYMSLDFWVDKKTKKLIRDKFKNDPYYFFSLFQMLHALNERAERISEKKEIYNSKGYYTDYKRSEYPWFFYFTDYFVKKKVKGTDQTNNLLLKQLSDGEQQFLHTLGICLMLKNKRTLLMLDEPETHFNPSWRSKFINILRKALEAGGDNFIMKDILLTSHSPFIISDCMPNNVILFKKEDEGNIIIRTAKDKDFNTYGSSIDLILQEIFDMSHSISENALEEIRILLQETNIDSIIEGSKRFGESYEKGFLYERIEELRIKIKKKIKK